MSGTGVEQCFSIFTDSFGNVYIAGSFAGSLSFASSKKGAIHEFDVFVVKWTGAGAQGWARTFGGKGGDKAMGVAIGSSGDIFLTGHFATQLLTLSSKGDEDIFVLRLKP